MTTPENVGPEKWVPAAIAQQEEYIKRQHSCRDQLGRRHSYDNFARIDKETGNVIRWSACFFCSVTETNDDYLTKIGETS